MAYDESAIFRTIVDSSIERLHREAKKRRTARCKAKRIRDARKKARKPKLAYISINAHTIRANAVNGTNDSPIRIASSPSDKAPIYAHQIKIDGPSKLVYDARCKLLACGARLVLVANYNDVRIVR